MQIETASLEEKFFTWLVSGVFISLLIVSGLAAYGLERGRSQYISGARETTKTLAALLQSNLFTSIRDMDLTLRQAEVEFRRLHAQQRFSAEAFSAYVRSLKERMPDATSIHGANAQGLQVFGEGLDPARTVQLTDEAAGKEMFERARSEHGVVFGLPVKSRISGLWVLPVARALRLEDGSFGGLVYVHVTLEPIASMFSALSANTRGEITLFDTKRRVLHQSLASEGAKIGAPFLLEPAIERALLAGQSVAAYLSQGEADGKQHIAKLNAITPYPIYVSVRLDVDEVLAQWQHRAYLFVLLVLILYTMAGVMLLAIKRSMQRQRLAQDHVQRQTRLLDEVINQLPFGVVAYDAQRTLRLGNRKYGELLKIPSELLQRKGLNFADVVHYAYARGEFGYAETEDVVLNRFVDLMVSRQTVHFERQQPDGTFVEFRGMPLSDNWALWTFTDISAHKASEKSLQAASQVADAANQVKSNFLATMSHEIRTPMNAVLGMLKLLQQTELSRRQLDYTQKAVGATHALLGIINDILDFSKVEAGKLELHNEPMVVGELMRDLSTILSSNVASKDVEVLFSLAADVPPVLLCDVLRLRQILLNLAGNAIKFTEQGEVVLGIRMLGRRAQQVVLEFSVQDTGIGIPADKVEHIFEAFSQAESSTTRRFGGTGLGLAISRQLVALMGGTLTLSSVVGQGSRFYFSAPFDIGPDALVVPPQVPAGRGLRVLIVDDNALARSILQKMASSMGWLVEALDSGEAAIEHLGRADAPDYDLVLMDWHMPAMDGWEATRRIRHLHRNGSPPVVIMVTAVGREVLAERAKLQAELLDGYLVKPITASMLYEAVSEALDERSGERRLYMPQSTGKRLQGLRLLVVEDNLLNQQIAQELLQGDGAEVEIAVCGLDGVAQGLAAQPPFDAILMDMQMPDIDGLEATRRLRSHAAMQAVPIIAMTANAMPADKQACIEAGMVDHVAKPFDLDHLIATILRHVPRPKPVAGLSPGVERELPQAADIGAVVDMQAAIARLGGSRDFYETVVASFRQDAAQQWEELQRQVALSDYPKAMHCAHNLKGLAGTVGAMGLSQRTAQIEAALNQSKGAVAPSQACAADRAAIDDLLAPLAHALAQTMAALDHV